MCMWYVLSDCIIVGLRVSVCMHAAGCLSPCTCVFLNVNSCAEVCIAVFVQGRNVGFSCMCKHVYAVLYSLWCMQLFHSELVPYFFD